MYCSSLWFDSIKTFMGKLKIAYNNKIYFYIFIIHGNECVERVECILPCNMSYFLPYITFILAGKN